MLNYQQYIIFPKSSSQPQIFLDMLSVVNKCVSWVFNIYELKTYNDNYSEPF
jgi:hypothetical protein